MLFTVLALAHPNPIVHVNAALNALAAVLLVLGIVLIKRRREAAHKQAMLAAFAVSTAFLACYLWYHYQAGHVEFTHQGAVRKVYYAILASHIILALLVPPLAIRTIYLGWRGYGPSEGQNERKMRYRQQHIRWARVTFPIWFYVSVTGVVVYAMLYHLYPAEVDSGTLNSMGTSLAFHQ